MSHKNLHRIILSIPGLFVVIVLFFSRQVELALLLLVFDVIGTIGGIWWLGFSKKIAHHVHHSVSKKHGSLLTPKRILGIFAIAIVAVFVMWGMVAVIKVATGNVVNTHCIEGVSRQAWVDFGNCLKAGGKCINPISVC